ncbi:MAG TPA: DNA polymerase III subunit gamma/tau [Terriglobales bacterium]|nr:DNA polymerase III subunit gamma/tau [Terriglobales bacterium]
MEKVLARRYRPQTFDEVIGQEAVVRTLENALAAGRVGHGFIFSGHRGIGKTTVARILAKAMNCRRAPGPTPTPCGECESCREIREGNSVDVIEIDAASNRGIDEIRALRESVRYRPARDRYKFYILDEAHQLTDDAFNALLKTLEEPPEWAIFVLATTEPEALPATIRSRCQHFAFRAVSYARIVERLRQICQAEGIAAEDEALGLIAAAGEGSLRDALSLLDQALAYGAGALRAEMVRALLGRVSSQALGEMMAAVADGNSREVLERADAFLAAGASPAQICQQTVGMIRNMLMCRVAGAESELLALSDTERKATAAAAERFGEEDLTRFLQILLRTAADLRFAQEPRLHLELGLVKLVQARRLASIEDVLASLGAEQKKTPHDATGSGAAAAAGGGGSRAGGGAGRETPPSARFAPEADAPGEENAAAPERAAATEPPAPAGDPARAKVLARLEELKRTSLLSVLQPAVWTWAERRLELRFAGEAAALAPLAKQDSILRELREVCRVTLGFAPEIEVRVVEVPGPAAPAPATDGTPAAERAARHPALRALREHVPGHVLRTIELSE